METLLCSRRLAFAAVLTGLIGLTGCGAVSSADSGDDAQKWQGTWKLTSVTENGATQAANFEWIVEGDQYQVRMDGRNGDGPYKITLDAKNKRIDVFHHSTPAGTWGGALKGIYEISGDSLTVCYDGTGQHYPKSFDASPGSRQILYKFRRV